MMSSFENLRDMLATASHNDGTRTLKQSILVPEVVAALRDWTSVVHGGVLIGGLAFSNHARPRQTMDADVLMVNPSELPEHVVGFKRVRPHAFRHIKTGVEIETPEPSTINMSPALARWVLDSAVSDSSLGVSIRVASPSGVVASKLGRWALRDQADVDELLDNFVIDVSEAPLPAAERNRLTALTVERKQRRSQ